IEGEIPPIYQKVSKLAYIGGAIPPIASKNVKKIRFARHKRKTSPYLHQNELHSTNNRNISAYFTTTLCWPPDKRILL
ncbi:hypothetical protein, partial [Neobacillus niacini]|uniref:hypothetical protein n=1 Tax=Neobacillus niacini TaxID=86668 RepID=UPI003983A1A2